MSDVNWTPMYDTSCPSCGAVAKAATYGHRMMTRESGYCVACRSGWIDSVAEIDGKFCRPPDYVERLVLSWQGDAPKCMEEFQ